jgi:DNA-binding transcriptional LysR family regulator
MHTNRVELRHLRYFVAVAGELSFTRAAERLGMSQPPLGQQIRQLEREVGVRLFERTKRRVELTEAGRVFLAAADRILRKADEAVDAARRAGRGEVGTLVVGFISSASYEVLPRLLGPYRERHPDVRLRFEQLTTSRQVQALAEGSLHVGLLGERQREGWLEQAVVAREELMAVLPAAHRLAGRRRVRLADLAGEPFVLHPREAAPRNHDRILALCQRAGFTARVEQEAAQSPTIAGLVAAGVGVSLLPGSVRHVRIPGVAFLPLADEVAPAEIVATWRRGDRSPLLAGLLDAIRAAAR